MKLRTGLRRTLLLSLGLAGLLPLAAVSFLAYQNAKSSLLEKSHSAVASIRDLKLLQLHGLFESFDVQLEILSKNPMIHEALDASEGALAQGAQVGSAEWTAAAAPYVKGLETIKSRNGWYDVFLISPAGRIAYTVAGESDLGQEIGGAGLRGSALAEAFTAAKENPGRVGSADFKPYAPSNNEPASFRVIALQGGGDEIRGYLAMQLPADKINSIMARRDGLGKLGETYLVGPDGRMRSDSVLDPESFSVLASFRQGEGHVRSQAITAASEGRSGTARARNYLGSRVISAYAPFEGPGGSRWAFVAEIDEDEALEDLHRIERRMQVTTVVMMVLVCVGAYILAKRIERPVRASARELHETSDQVKQASSEVSVSAQKVAEGASEQAAALEEISASIEELLSMTQGNFESSNRAHTTMQAARSEVEHAESEMSALLTTIESLARSSQETGKIIKAIDEIAFQTNLLALNASVEAARAGEAGAGFAVVAEEVRSLARRAAESAKQSSGIVQESTQLVEKGSTSVQSTHDIFVRIRQTAEQMMQLMEDIRSSSDQQKTGITQIASAITQLDGTTQGNAASAEESASAAEEMHGQAGRIGEISAQLQVLLGEEDAARADAAPPKAPTVRPLVQAPPAGAKKQMLAVRTLDRRQDAKR